MSGQSTVMNDVRFDSVLRQLREAGVPIPEKHGTAVSKPDLESRSYKIHNGKCSIMLSGRDAVMLFEYMSQGVESIILQRLQAKGKLKPGDFTLQTDVMNSDYPESPVGLYRTWVNTSTENFVDQVKERYQEIAYVMGKLKLAPQVGKSIDDVLGE